MFTVQISVDGDDFTTRIAEVSEWFKIHRVAPGAFQYKMRPEHVRLRVDFTTSREAAAFAEALGGSVLGTRRVAVNAA